MPLGRGAAALGDARLITKGEKPVDGLLHRFGIEAVERNPDPLAFQHHVHVADPGIAEAGNTAAEIFGKLGGSARQLGMTDLMIAVPALMPAIAAGTSRWSAAWMVTQEGSVPWPSAARG